MYTRLRPGELSVKFEGECTGSAAQMLSILREVDLLHTWNRYSDFTRLLRNPHPYEMWVAAGSKLPWPIPKQSMLLHVQLAHDPDSPRGLVASSYSPSAEELPKGVELPRELRSRLKMNVRHAAARLRPLPASADAARTSFEGVICLDMSRIAGGAAVTSMSWLVNLVVYLIAPTILNTYVGALGAVLSEGSGNLYTARMKADSSGVYARFAQRTQQKRR